MKKCISLITAVMFILTGCGNSAPTQKDLENAGFTPFGDDYGYGYTYESPDEEYYLGVGVDTDMLGYLTFIAESPDEELDAYIPFDMLGQDITTSSYKFVDYSGDSIDEVEFTNDYYGVKGEFESSEYSEQFESLKQFIIENFADENASDSAFSFQQDIQ